MRLIPAKQHSWLLFSQTKHYYWLNWYDFYRTRLRCSMKCTPYFFVLCSIPKQEIWRVCFLWSNGALLLPVWKKQTALHPLRTWTDSCCTGGINQATEFGPEEHNFRGKQGGNGIHKRQLNRLQPLILKGVRSITWFSVFWTPKPMQSCMVRSSGSWL